MDIQAILDAIPHRYPILLVDRVLENDPGQSIHALKNVSVNEPFFQGHFPGRPIMPGVLQIEALAQASGICALSTAEDEVGDKLLLFRGIEKVKFRRTVVPGDQLHLHGRMLKRKRHLWTFSCKAMVDGEVATEAEVSAAILAADAAK